MFQIFFANFVLICLCFTVTLSYKQIFQYQNKVFTHRLSLNINNNNKVINDGNLIRNKIIFMSSPGRGSSGGGSTKIDRKVSQKTAIKPSFKEEIEKDWRLILHDDTVHTIQQVCDILTTVLYHFTINISNY